MSDVLLICMPFAAIQRPSIGLGILQALLEREGIAARGVYANIDFCEEIGHCAFRFWEETLGDLVFAAAAFPEHQPNLTTYLKRQFARKKAEAAHCQIASTLSEFEAAACSIRKQAVAFVDRLAIELLRTSPRIVGCTSMYWQHTASLAILRRVRELAPSVVTMLGGANCEGVMGLATHRNFPWIDFVVSGDADDLIGSLCTQVLRAGRAVPSSAYPSAVFGPAERKMNYALTLGGAATPRGEVKDLNAVPSPDFDDYFESLKRTSVGHSVRPGLLIETARGCWYGQVHHCKFCGISEGGMKFNVKSSERVLAEFRELEQRHKTSAFEVTDNILSMGFFNSVLPELASRPERLRIFWETKANLKRSQVDMLAKSGVSWIQPGIESLDSGVLKLMDKGVHASQNIQLLRWCREVGIRAVWNILWGLPGESDDWYYQMADLIPLLHHLQPPRVVVRMRYDRYSVYHTRSREYGLELQPMEYMKLAFPLPSAELSDLAYYFEAVSENGRRREPLSARPGVRALNAAVETWKRRFWNGLAPIVSVWDNGCELSILDTRDCAPAREAKLHGPERDAYLACENMPLRANMPAQEAVESLKQRKLLLEIDGRLVMLGLSGSIPPLPPPSAFPGGAVVPGRRRPAAGVPAAS